MSQVSQYIYDEKAERKFMTSIDKLTNWLSTIKDSPVKIKLPDGDVPEHFHVTEIGRVDRKFVDCGGALRLTQHCSMQVWVANDVDHRITTTKLSGMFGKVQELISLHDLPVQIEYGDKVAATYNLKDVEFKGDDGLVLVIEPKQTECLAPEICGVEVLENNCCSEEGCC